ncbi:lipopolysaccharide biosynthesis protein [Tuwongella immobilis]|uniref:Uncharacterized protein n=1 Tax=Tuwongella immobilis TaxID=692036 RepID=A0A6C2YL60_9BACT|nr:oligosaccharide flippase family protein [Tuwongella immobilis]VIP02114.1 Polysaccharide biosynthesis protein OS=candidate division ZIXI bacterium RBG-1 GN=RBG1_1C00001G1893 PE=4 SV=1: Polysacc_synt: Polysacc_synt_C [Tuwongella immobilis]VTS00428.1 Polysaccharide biosynthesis protein OS=candidate division ZIXI bacterium RBG-1 GN=RBG1_1C00001G1893 PE=4 SV=1: Polysacc_synt: Polysacc_synt_C [Tuwongella immobilis]
MTDRSKPVVQRRLLRGALTNWLAFAAVMASSFFLAPYLIRRLGDATYGVWGFVESILAYLTLLDLGVAACVTRYVAKLHTTGERDELNRLVSSCLALFCIAGGAILAIGTGLSWWLAPTLQAKADLAGNVLPFMLLMVANLAVTLPLGIYPSILDGLERYTQKSLIRLVALVVRVAGIVAVTELSPGLFGLGMVLTLTNLAEHLAYVLLVRRVMPELVLSRRLVDRVTLARVKGYSVDAFLAMLAGRITVQTAAVVIGMMISAVAVTHFLIASRLVEMAKSLLRSATTTLTPAFSSLEAQGKIDEMRAIYLTATRLSLLLGLPLALGMIWFGPAFLTRWLHSAEYVTVSYPTLWILAATLPFVVAQSAAARVLYGVGRLRGFARMALVEAAVNLTLSLILVRSMGIQGVAIAVAIPNVLFCIAVIVTACSHLQIRASVYLRTAWLRPIALNLPLALAGWAITRSFPLETWGELALAGAVGGLPYLLMVAITEGKFPKWLAPRELLKRMAGKLSPGARASAPANPTPAPRATGG